MRAQTHLSAIYNGIETNREKNRYRLRREPNADGSEHVYHLGKIATPSALFATQVSDCLHNLRACLDNLVYRLAELNQQTLGKTVSKTVAGGLSFPICKDSGPFEAARPDALKCTSEGAKNLVLNFQPYNRSHPVDTDPLWTLRKLQDVDKHRFLVRLQLDILTINFDVVPGYETELVPGPAFMYPNRRLEDDEWLCTVNVNPPSLETDFNLNPDFPVVFDKGPAEGQNVVFGLNDIRVRIGEVLGEAHKLPEVAGAP